MIITRFGGQPLRNEEYFRHKTEIMEAISKSGINIVPFLTILNTFSNSLHDVDIALEIIRKSAYTEEVNEADRERDITTSGFINIVTGLTKHFNPEKRKQANELKIIFDHYKGINKQSIASQTASTVNMLQSLRDKHDLITELNLNEWLDQLDAINQRVAELTMNRFDESASKPEQRMKEVRPLCDEQLNKLYNAIETFAQITPDEPYDNCISLINAINKKYIDTIAQRRGIAEAKKKEEEEEE